MDIEPLRVEESEYQGTRTRLYIFPDCVVEVSGVEKMEEDEIQARVGEALQRIQASRAPEEPGGEPEG